MSTTSRPPSRTSMTTSTCRWRTTATTMSFLHPNLPSPRPTMMAARRRRPAGRRAFAASTASDSCSGASGRRRSATRTRAHASGSAHSTRPMTPPGPTTSPPAASAAARPGSTSPTRPGLGRARNAPAGEPRLNGNAPPTQTTAYSAAHAQKERDAMMAKPELMESFGMDAFVDLTTAVTALPPVMASSFADTGAKKPMVDEDSSDGSGGDAILGFDPFMLFQLPCSDTYESIDSLFAGDSLEEFPMDSAIF